MPRCLILTPFPVHIPRHGGQVRTATLALALRHAGWQVDIAGIYLDQLFLKRERGPLDIVIQDAATWTAVQNDQLFADLHVARHAATSRRAVRQLRKLIRRLAPDVIQVEHPWPWLPLRKALSSLRRPLIVYSSHNLEWRAREQLSHLGLQRPDTARRIEEVRALETEFARDADLVFSVSDIEAEQIEHEAGRPVVYLPPVSELADQATNPDGRFATESCAAGIRYCALMASAYWPNCEGFFQAFPAGLDFLSADEQIWIAGSLGNAVRSDPRFDARKDVNEPHTRMLGYLADAEKMAFYAAASCVILPVFIGAGAKAKTAEAIASGRPVIATSHALEGYGPIVRDAVGNGIYLADAPDEFRRLAQAALRDGLQGCAPEVRARVSPARMSATMKLHLEGLISANPRAKEAPSLRTWLREKARQMSLWG
jgi:glycosyltransferase involved in cell wall biosynthesis